MKMTNEAGEVVYYNCVSKGGHIRYIIKAASGQMLPGRDRQKLRSRTFTRVHDAEAFLRRLGYHN